MTSDWRVTESIAVAESSAGWTSSTREPNEARNEEATIESCHQVRDAVVAALTADEHEDRLKLPFQRILAGECLYCPDILSAYWKHLEGTGKRIGIILHGRGM